jgi:hypothetical protein
MIVGIVLWLVLLAASAVALLGGLLQIGEGFDRYAQATAIRDRPVSSLDSFALGNIGVRGTVVPDDPAISQPIGNGVCVAYDLRVFDSALSEGSLVREQRVVPFFVETDAGRIRVTGDDIDFEMSEERSETRVLESWRDTPDDITAFEHEWGLSRPDMGDERTYEQSTVGVGDTVSVYGQAVQRGTGDAEDKGAVLSGEGDLFFISDKTPSQLLSDRRYGVARAVAVGTATSTLGLVGVLFLTGAYSILL